MGALGVPGHERLLVLPVTTLVAGTVVVFGFSPVGAAGHAQTDRVSVSSTGAQATGNSYLPSVSAHGRFVTYMSSASNLVAGDTNRDRDVFVYDRATHRTRRVSVSSTGRQANGGSSRPSISADGRFVTYQSNASNLVAGDTNRTQDVFVYDRATHKTRRVSVSSTGRQANDYSIYPSISPGGRFVTYTSKASNLIRADTNKARDVFVYDRTTHKTRRVSVSSTGRQANDYSSGSSISAHGRFVTYQSNASNLVAGDTNRDGDVFVYDRSAHKTRRVSVSSTGTQGNHRSSDPSISADGRFVTYMSSASNLVAGDLNRDWDVFVYDRATHKTRRVSVSSTGTQANGGSIWPSISADGRFVAFLSGASNLVAGDTNRNWDVFVYDRATHKTRRVSVSSTGTQANGNSFWPSISADGQFVVFEAESSNLVRADTNDRPDVFIRGPLR